MTTTLEKLKVHLKQLCEIRDELENDTLDQMRTFGCNNDTFEKYVKAVTHIQKGIFELRETIIAIRKM